MLSSLVMNSLSTLIVQLRSIARSPLHAHIREHRVESAAKNRNGSRKSKPVVRKSDEDEKMDGGEKFDASNVYISANPASGQLAGRCPRCLLDFRFKDTSSASATTQSTGKCQPHRYRRSGRRARKPRPSAAAANAKSSDGALSKKSVEFLRTFLSVLGKQHVAGPEFTPENLSQLIASFTRMTSQPAMPKIGLFIEALPLLVPANPSESFSNYVDILQTIARRLSTISSPQIDRETQAMMPSVVRKMKLVDSSVQCEQEIGLFDIPLNITILERHLDWTPVSVSSKPNLRLRTDSKRSLPPIAKRVVFKPGEDLILKLGGFASLDDDVCGFEKCRSDCACTMNEIPSDLVVKPRCKDVTSLPAQGTMERAFAPRSHRSCTQSEYLTKTAMSLLNESQSSANIFALLNSDSFNSEKSKRNLGNFLLKERMKRFLSSILSQNRSKTSFKSDEMSGRCGEFGNPSSATRNFPKEPKSRRNVSLKWDLEQMQVSKSAATNVSSNESVTSSDVKSCAVPKSILIGCRESPAPDYVDAYCQCDSRTNLDDIEQEELRVLRQILLRSCSFTETESACHLCLALDRKSLLRAVMAALRGSEEDRKKMQRLLPRDCCSFAEYEPNRRGNVGGREPSADDVITTTTRIRFSDDDAPFAEKCVQTDGRWVASDQRSRSWSSGVGKDLWIKNFNAMAAS